jgi:DNA-binding HxlR family transcriptional regulator
MQHRRKLEKDIRCPLEYGLDVFGGKWKSRIICVLSTKGRLRYSQLRDEMTNVSDAVLSASLKELIASGMVLRQSFDEIPPRVEYSLTPRGLSAVPILRSICAWAGQVHREVTSDAPRQCQTCDYVDVEPTGRRASA